MYPMTISRGLIDGFMGRVFVLGGGCFDFVVVLIFAVFYFLEGIYIIQKSLFHI